MSPRALGLGLGLGLVDPSGETHAPLEHGSEEHSDPARRGRSSRGVLHGAGGRCSVVVRLCCGFFFNKTARRSSFGKPRKNNKTWSTKHAFVCLASVSCAAPGTRASLAREPTNHPSAGRDFFGRAL